MEAQQREEFGVLQGTCSNGSLLARYMAQVPCIVKPDRH